MGLERLAAAPITGNKKGVLMTVQHYGSQIMAFVFLRAFKTLPGPLRMGDLLIYHTKKTGIPTHGAENAIPSTLCAVVLWHRSTVLFFYPTTPAEMIRWRCPFDLYGARF